MGWESSWGETCLLLPLVLEEEEEDAEEEDEGATAVVTAEVLAVGRGGRWGLPFLLRRDDDFKARGSLAAARLDGLPSACEQSDTDLLTLEPPRGDEGPSGGAVPVGDLGPMSVIVLSNSLIVSSRLSKVLKVFLRISSVRLVPVCGAALGMEVTVGMEDVWLDLVFPWISNLLVSFSGPSDSSSSS